MTAAFNLAFGAYSFSKFSKQKMDCGSKPYIYFPLQNTVSNLNLSWKQFLSFQIKDFENSITRFLFSFFLSKAIYKPIILYFSESYFIIYLHTVELGRNLNPTTRRTSRTTSRWSSTRNVEIENYYKQSSWSVNPIVILYIYFVKKNV